MAASNSRGFKSFLIWWDIYPNFQKKSQKCLHLFQFDLSPLQFYILKWDTQKSAVFFIPCIYALIIYLDKSLYFKFHCCPTYDHQFFTTYMKWGELLSLLSYIYWYRGKHDTLFVSLIMYVSVPMFSSYCLF